MKFAKYHALGNDYIVLNPSESFPSITKDQIRLLCHRNYGIGSDGILFGPIDTEGSDFGLRIFNPDGSEAEKSGNGLRIFSRYLWDNGLVKQDSFTIETLGGSVTCRVQESGRIVTVDMGIVSFMSNEIPVAGPSREVLNETIRIGDEEFTFCAATIGNPHCIVFCEEISEQVTRRLGALIEADGRFPNRTNVQFLKVIDRGNIRIEIWERGAGYTLASGSSSTASAAVAYKLGLCGSDIAVHMPGGVIQIFLSPDFSASMTGPVTRVSEGVIDEEMFEP
ncbi:diaminopimelate epimerase [Thermodesulfobacteriota bacterium]